MSIMTPEDQAVAEAQALLAAAKAKRAETAAKERAAAEQEILERAAARERKALAEKEALDKKIAETLARRQKEEDDRLRGQKEQEEKDRQLAEAADKLRREEDERKRKEAEAQRLSQEAFMLEQEDRRAQADLIRRLEKAREDEPSTSEQGEWSSCDSVTNGGIASVLRRLGVNLSPSVEETDSTHTQVKPSKVDEDNILSDPTPLDKAKAAFVEAQKKERELFQEWDAIKTKNIYDLNLYELWQKKLSEAGRLVFAAETVLKSMQ